MNLFTISSLLCSSYCFTLAIFSLISGRTKIHWLLSLFNLAVTLWGLGCFIAAISKNREAILYGWKIAYLGGFWIAPIFYHLAAGLSGSNRKILIVLGYAQGAVFNILNLSTNTVMNHLVYRNQIPYVIATKTLTLAILIYLLFLGLSYRELIKGFRLPNELEKIRFKFVSLGFLIGFLGGTSVLLPSFGWHLFAGGNFGILIYSAVITYAVLRERILDNQEIAEIAHNDKLNAMGILSASINHELRNPLYIIKNFSESLSINTREGVYKDPQKLEEKMLDTLDRITKQSNQAMKIIGRLTAFARKKPDQDFKMVPVSLRSLIEDLDILIRCEIEVHRIEIIQEIPENLPQLLADPAHLEEILLNLILNAYQVLKNFPSPIPLPEGEGTGKGKKIYIQAAVTPKGTENTSLSVPFAQKIQITIKDNGPGISPEDLPNIFKPFYTKKKEGLGLGLYITKQLIEKNQGTIKIESSPGHGAAFILEFNQV